MDDHASDEGPVIVDQLTIDGAIRPHAVSTSRKERSMQEDAVEWDPQYIHHEPGWAIRIYVLYILFTAIYVTVKSVTLIYALWLRPLKATNANTADQVAKVALKGSNRLSASTEAVAEHFNYLAANVDAEIRMLMRSSTLSFISALAACTVGLMNTLHGVSSTRPIGLGAISGGVAESLTLAALGLILGLGTFFMASLFENRLARNRAKWSLFYAASPES
jgi:hypothetical protein